jgi:hypothetical protein
MYPHDPAPAPAPRVGPDISPFSPGFCYTHWIREDARDQAVSKLGFNPEGFALADWLHVHRSVWTKTRCTVTYGARRLDDDLRAYVQVHIQPLSSGLTVGQFLQLCLHDVRVGMDVQSPTGAHAAVEGASVRNVPVPAVAPVKKLPFYCMLSNTAGDAAKMRCWLSPRNSNMLKNLTKFYESAVIEGFEMEATINGGADVTLFFGVSSGTSTPSGANGFLTMPLCAVYSGTPDGAGRASYRLPSGHGFGTEVKAASLGNPDPTFHWLLEAADAANAVVRGFIMLRLAGHGVPEPFGLASGP